MQGDLGAVDEKYDVAISTACGALDNIVVDTMDTAIKCVQFLRQNNIGVATFIGLDKVGVVVYQGLIEAVLSHMTHSLQQIEHLRSKAMSKISTYVCS